MLIDLVRIQTADGYALDGAVQRPRDLGLDVRPLLPLDAVILVHGTGSNFYQSTLLELIADTFVKSGIAALRVNTRGHDGISTAVTSKGGLRQGAAFETVDDCRHDLLAWVKYTQSHCGPRVALVGHSLGAVKCLYAARHVRDLETAILVAISPPRLSYSWFRNSEKKNEFLQSYHNAKSFIDAGRPNTLMEVTMPLPMIISAGGYVDKYGPDERINFLPLVSDLQAPALFTFGSNEIESNVAFQQLPEEINAAPPGRHGREVAVIPGADHFYSGKRKELIDAIFGHLSGLNLKP